jgi:hypothetical protein
MFKPKIMSKDTATPQVDTSKQLESSESHEGQGATLSPPAFQLMASSTPIQREEGTVQERFAAHSITQADLTDQYVIDQFTGMSIEALFEYRRLATVTEVKTHILGLIDGRERDPFQSYLGKKFTVNNAAAVIRNAAGTPLTYVAGDTMPAGKKVGDQKIIPNGTEVYITEVNANLRYVFAEDWGWTGINNIQGGMYNETLSIDRAEYDSQDPNHKTIATPNCAIRSGTAVNTYPAVEPTAKIPKDTHVMVLETVSEDNGNVRVSLPDGSQVWTRSGNVGTTVNADGTRTVTDADARIRQKAVEYPVATGTVAQGERVIVLTQSPDTVPVGKYIEIGYTKKNTAGTYERDTDKPAVWIAASDIVANWADFKSDNARWAKNPAVAGKGNYLGQMDVVTMVGRDDGSDSQEVEKISPELLGHYNTLRAQAATAGHEIKLNSGWRSFPDQQELWDDNPNPSEVAPPGRSNHQNGIAIDINTGSFGSSMYEWMKTNAPALGWIRTVGGEHWHWEQRPADAALHGYKMPGVSP